MKKCHLTIVFLIIAASLVAETQKTIISQSSGSSIILQKSFDPESLAHFDRIELVGKDGKALELFASEGRNIEKVFEPDIDGDGSRELLIQMDLGGSGGYKEFSLLKKVGQNYNTIWESAGFAGAKTSLSPNKKTGKTWVLIRYFDDEDEAKKPLLAVFGWKNNEFKRLR